MSLGYGCATMLAMGAVSVWSVLLLTAAQSWPGLLPRLLPLHLQFPPWGNLVLYALTVISETWFWLVLGRPASARGRAWDSVPLAGFVVGIVLSVHAYHYASRHSLWEIAFGAAFLAGPLLVRSAVWPRMQRGSSG